MSTVEALEQRLAAAEADRDHWKAKANALLATPATAWPVATPRPLAPYPTYDRSKPKESFLAMQDYLIEDIRRAQLEDACQLKEREVTWICDMLKYNLTGGKLNRGMMAVESGIHLFEHQGKTVTNDDLSRFVILGWCLELLQAWLLILDDVMDSSETRRGKPCWYKQPHVGTIALNDGVIVEALTFKILKRHFGSEPCYPQLVDLFLHTAFQTECGQLMDTICCNLALQDFTVDRWNQIVTYKTAFYSFFLAVAAPMVLSGIADVAAYDKTREILVIMGVYFQAQDDYLDCFATPEELGKIGTDIQDKKCSWLFAHAYNELASPEEKKMLDEHYGRAAVGSLEEAAIKELYVKLGLPALYKKYEEESYARILALKETCSPAVPWVVFETFLHKIYKRRN